MNQVIVSKSTLQFLKELAANNNRDWFNEHKQSYIQAQQNMSNFADALIQQMNKHDQLENDSGKKSLYRIYNDVRFSKDKSPYHTWFGIGLQRATKFKRGGYYLQIKPGNSYLACGFFRPNPDDLKRIRVDIDSNFMDWNKILNQKQLKEVFGEMKGEKLLTSPRGFINEHPAIELLRHKQFIFRHHFKDSEVISENFLQQVNLSFKAIRPYFNYMSELLTTTVNGEINV